MERIVEELESGELSLNEAIKRYEEGMKLSQFCTRRLHDIQKRIEVLVKDSSGNLSARAFSEKDVEKVKTSGAQGQKEQHRKVSPERSRGTKKAEELLF